MESRWAEGRYERLPELAAELVRLKVEVIVTHAAGSRAAQRATTSIPIVFAALGDPQASGIVDNLARPGGNITGLSLFGPEITAKRLELALEAMPKVRRLAFLANANNVDLASSGRFQALEQTAKSLNAWVQRVDVKDAKEIETAIAAMGKLGIGAFVVDDDPMLLGNAAAMAASSVRHRIPAIAAVEFADAGGLVGFGADFPAMFNRAATFVDRILKGAKPGDLPVERASKFELVINQGAAKALRMKVPQSLLLRADRVIE